MAGPTKKRKPAKTALAAPKPRLREELSAGRTRALAGIPIMPFNPDELWRGKGLGTTDEMMRDGTVAKCMTIRALAPLTGWRIDPASESDEDGEVAEFVTRTLNGVPGEWITKLYMLARNVQKDGYAIAEKVWDLGSGQDAGKIVLRDLKVRRAKYFGFNSDEHGTLYPDRGLLQQFDGVTTPFPIDKFVIWSWERPADDHDGHYGTSVLRRVYLPWWAKDTVIKFYNIYLERFASPTITGTWPSGTDDADQEKFQKILDSIQFSTVVTFNEAFKATLLQAQARGEAGYKEAIDKYDQMIEEGLLGSSMAVSQDSTVGSFAMARVQKDTMALFVEPIRVEIPGLLGEQVIREIVDYNFTVTAYPTFVLEPYQQEDKLAKADAINKGKTAGAIKLWRLEDENAYRGLVDLPEITEQEWAEEEARRAEAAATIQQQVGDGKEGEQRRPFARALAESREALPIESHVDFAQVEADLSLGYQETFDRLVGIVERMRDGLLTLVEDRWEQMRADPSLVGSLRSLRAVGDLKNALRDHLQAIYAAGRATARRELPPPAQAKLAAPFVTPDDALAWLEAKAFTIAGVERDQILKQAKVILYNGIKMGKTTQEIAYELRQMFEPYVTAGEVEPGLLSPARLETIIRTNTVEAYAEGRLATFRDPDVRDTVEAVELSAILDERTTEICRYIDGRIVAVDDPDLNWLNPPLHWNCRTIPVPVLSGSTYELMTEAEKGQARVLIPAGFR